MRFFRDIPVILRLNIYFATFAFLIFSFFGFVIYRTQKDKLLQQVKKDMTTELHSLINFFYLDQNERKRFIKTANLSFERFINQSSEFFDLDTNFRQTVPVFNYELKDIQSIITYKWKYAGKSIDEKNDFLKSYVYTLNTQVALFQKTANGFVLLGASDKSLYVNDNRIFFPSENAISIQINKGNIYEGFLSINNKILNFVATPWYYKGEIIGFIATYSPNIISDFIKNFFNSKVYYKKGYPFIMNDEGILVVHPYLQDKSIRHTKVYFKIIEAKKYENYYTVYYKWPETADGEYKYMIEKYLRDYKLYIGVTFYEKDIEEQLGQLKRNILFAVLFSSILVILVITFILRGILSRVLKIQNAVYKLNRGEPFEKISVRFNDEIGALIKSLNQFNEHFSRWIEYTNNLAEGNYKFKISLLSEQDKLDENLLKIKDRLQKFEQAQLKREQEEKIARWRNEGLEHFIDILSTPNISLEELSKKLLFSIIEYFHCIEGGFFIVNDENKEEPYLELLAAFAYNQERNLQRKIPFGSGLVGRIAIEKKILILNEIPENYISINTALGGGKPNYLVLVPLMYMNEIIGVIELASIEPFKDYEIEFLQEISENIASTISALKIAYRTEKLLEQSRKQAQELEKQRETLEKQIQELEKVKRESEQKEQELQSIFQAIEQSAMLLEMDLEGHITAINKPYADLFSRPPEFFIGKHFQLITTMNVESDDYKKFFDTLKSGKTLKITEAINFGEKTVWLSHNYTPIKNEYGEIIKILDIAFDITETKLLEKQLRNQVKEIAKEARLIRKEERKIQREREEFLNKEINYKTIIETTDEFIIRVEHTIEGNITFVNKKFLNLVKAVETKVYKSNLKDYLSDDTLEKFNRNIAALKAGRKVRAMYKFKDTDGHIYDVEIMQVPIIKNQKVQKVILIGITK